MIANVYTRWMDKFFPVRNVKRRVVQVVLCGAVISSLPRFSRSPAGESQCGCPAMTEGTTANLIGRGEIASAAVNDPASRDRAGQLKKGWRQTGRVVFFCSFVQGWEGYRRSLSFGILGIIRIFPRPSLGKKEHTYLPVDGNLIEADHPSPP